MSDQPSAEVIEMQTAYLAVFAPAKIGPNSAAKMLARGLNPGTVSALGGWMRAAIDRWDVPAARVRNDVLDMVWAWMECPLLNPEHLAGWARVLLGAPDADEVQAQFKDWVAWADDIDDTPPAPHTWLGLPGNVGAAGWAAGLHPTDAAVMPVTHLQVLAALQGWVLSPAAAAGT